MVGMPSGWRFLLRGAHEVPAARRPAPRGGVRMSMTEAVRVACRTDCPRCGWDRAMWPRPAYQRIRQAQWTCFHCGFCYTGTPFPFYLEDRFNLRARSASGDSVKKRLGRGPLVIDDDQARQMAVGRDGVFKCGRQSGAVVADTGEAFEGVRRRQVQGGHFHEAAFRSAEARCRSARCMRRGPGR